jgi:hypothetical protein
LQSGLDRRFSDRNYSQRVQVDTSVLIDSSRGVSSCVEQFSGGRICKFRSDRCFVVSDPIGIASIFHPGRSSQLKKKCQLAPRLSPDGLRGPARACSSRAEPRSPRAEATLGPAGALTIWPYGPAHLVPDRFKVPDPIPKVGSLGPFGLKPIRPAALDDSPSRARAIPRSTSAPWHLTHLHLQCVSAAPVSFQFSLFYFRLHRIFQIFV